MIGAYHGWSGSLFIERPRCIVQPVDPVVADAVHKDYMRQVRGKGEVNEPWGTYDSASSKSDSESEFSDSSDRSLSCHQRGCRRLQARAVREAVRQERE